MVDKTNDEWRNDHFFYIPEKNLRTPRNHFITILLGLLFLQIHQKYHPKTWSPKEVSWYDGRRLDCLDGQFDVITPNNLRVGVWNFRVGVWNLKIAVFLLFFGGAF